MWSVGYDSVSDNTWDVSHDDGEQDSNSEGADESDETNDILDDFDGEEIDLMFSENYGEELSVRGRMVKHRSSYLITIRKPELNKLIGFSRKIEKYMTNDILNKFDGGEIELMFTKNYGEDEEKDD